MPIENFKGKEHTFTQEERRKGGRSRSLVKISATRLNALRSGKGATNPMIRNAIGCNGCAYRDTCKEFVSNSKCQILVTQVKEINKMGLSFELKEIALNYLHSLQRYTQEMVSIRTDLAKVRGQVEDFDIMLKNLRQESAGEEDLMAIRQLNNDRREMTDEKKESKREMFYLRNKYVEMERDYMRLLGDFKKIVLGDRVTVEAKISASMVVAEIEAAYNMFKEEEDAEASTFIVQ